MQSTDKCCLLFTVGTTDGHFGNEEYIESYGKTYNGDIYTDTLAVLLVHVGLAQARPNDCIYHLGLAQPLHMHQTLLHYKSDACNNEGI